MAATLAGSPANRAGLTGGDVIVSFNQKPIRDVNDLRIRVAGTEIGSPVTIGFLREGKPQEAVVTMEEEPES